MKFTLTTLAKVGRMEPKQAMYYDCTSHNVVSIYSTVSVEKWVLEPLMVCILPVYQSTEEVGS